MWGKPASIEIQIPGRYAEFESSPSNSYLLSGAVRRFLPSPSRILCPTAFARHEQQRN